MRVTIVSWPLRFLCGWMVLAALGCSVLRGRAGTAENVTSEVMEVIDLVMEKHIDPPTRQEMVLGAVRSLCAAAELEQPFDLSRRVSAVSDAAAFRSLMEEFAEEALRGEVKAGRLKRVMMEGVFAVVPGGTRLIDEKELKVEQQLAANRYVGTGIVLSMRDGRPTAQKVFRRGPGYRAGLKDGDKILEIDGKRTGEMGLEEVVALLRGQEGDAVALSVQQLGEEARMVVVTRGVVPRETVQGYLEMGDEQWNYDVSAAVGYVRLLEIGASTLHELRKAAEKMRSKGLRALVIDLRGQRRSGHDIQPAVLLANGLLDGGPIGRLRTRDGVQEFEATADCLFRDWPLAILVHRETGADGLFVASALQDNGRALVLGGELKTQRMFDTPVMLPGAEGAVMLATGVLEAPNHFGGKAGGNRGFKREAMKGRPGLVRRSGEPRDGEPERNGRDRQLDEAVKAMEQALERRG